MHIYLLKPHYTIHQADASSQPVSINSNEILIKAVVCGFGIKQIDNFVCWGKIAYVLFIMILVNCSTYL